MSTFSFGFGNDDDGGGGGGAAVATASVVTNSNLAGAAEEVALVARCSEVLPPACDSEDYDAGTGAPSASHTFFSTLVLLAANCTAMLCTHVDQLLCSFTQHAFYRCADGCISIDNINNVAVSYRT